MLQAYVSTYSLPAWMVGEGALGESPLSPKRGLLPVKELATLLRETERGLQSKSPEEAADFLMNLFCAPELLRDEWVSMLKSQREAGILGMGLGWYSDPISKHIDYEHLKKSPDKVREVDDWYFSH